MRKDPKSEALRWLRQAEEEFKDAIRLKDAKRYYLSLFLCQQSAEKAIKAYLYVKEEELLFSHSLDDLLKLATEYDLDFKHLQNAKRLDDYYIPTRYPNGLPGGIPSDYYDDPGEVEKALQMSDAIIKLARKKVDEQA